MKQRMSFVFRWLLTLILVTACGPRMARELPRRMPIEQSYGSEQLGMLTLRASTNCAEVGEPITLTLTLDNVTTKPITLTADPLLEMRLEPLRPVSATNDIIAWSDDPTYPVITPTLQPHERRIYHWTIVADRRFAATETLSEDGIVIRMRVPLYSQDITDYRLEFNVYVGVRSLRTGTEEGVSLCTELRK